MKLLYPLQRNPTFELAGVEIVDTKPQEELMKIWGRFLCRAHFGTTADLCHRASRVYNALQNSAKGSWDANRWVT
jgi:hypothetical protein